MTTRNKYGFQDPHPHWTLRSLLAAGGVAACLVATALSITTLGTRAEEAKKLELAIASEVELAAEFANFMTAETIAARESLLTPRPKPAKQVVSVLADRGGADEFVNFDFTLLTVARLDAEERKCLTQAIYYEARSEPRVGQMAVADVVLNRVASPVYPNSVCEVVFQGSQRRTGCQFSFTCDGSIDARLNKRKWRQTDDLAGAILAGVRAPVSRNATHYHANYVSPSWSLTLTPTATIGSHKFYRFPSRRTVAAAPAAM